MTEFKVYFDGANRKNPSRFMGLGVVLYKNDKEIESLSLLAEDENGSNNVAEYLSCEYALKLAKQRKIKKITVYGDSMLVIKQINGEYKVKAAHLKPLRENILNLKKYFDEVNFFHVMRNENKRADELANEALDTKIFRYKDL